MHWKKTKKWMKWDFLGKGDTKCDRDDRKKKVDSELSLRELKILTKLYQADSILSFHGYEHVLLF